MKNCENFIHIHTPGKYEIQKALVISAISVNILLCGAILGAKCAIKGIKKHEK